MALFAAYALFLLGIVAFGIGLVGDRTTWIYVSIISTATAGLVIFAVHRLERRAAPSTAGPAVAPGGSVVAPAEPVATASAEADVEPDAPAPAEPDAEPVAPASADADAEQVVAVSAEADAEPVGSPSEEAGRDAEPLAHRVATGTSGSAAFDDRLFALPPSIRGAFPIADFDELRVGEILPLLPRLDAAELAIVRGRELQAKRRATILARIEELMGAASPGSAVGPAVADPTPDAVAVNAADPVAPAPDASDAPPPRAALRAAPGGRAAPEGGPAALGRVAPTAADPEASDGFPIPGYAALRVVDIVPLLRPLDPDQLAAVAQRERQGAKRQTVLNRIDDLLVARTRVDGPPGRLPEA